MEHNVAQLQQMVVEQSQHERIDVSPTVWDEKRKRRCDDVVAYIVLGHFADNDEL